MIQMRSLCVLYHLLLGMLAEIHTYILCAKMKRGDVKMVNKNNTSIQRGYEVVNFCEFDKYAAKSYCAVHKVDESLNLGDITQVDETNL